jgi:hypothetical protein
MANNASSGLLPLRTGRRLAECTPLGGLCEECKDKVNATVKNNPVRTVSGGGWMERQTDRAHQGGNEMEDSQSAPHRAASARSVKCKVERKVNATVKYNLV